MGFSKDSKDIFYRYKLIKEQSVVAVDPSHFDYSDPYWQTPEGKAEKADRDQRYNAMLQRQQNTQQSTQPANYSQRLTGDLWWDQKRDYAKGAYPELDDLWDKVKQGYQSGDDKTYTDAIKNYERKLAEIEQPKRPQTTTQPLQQQPAEEQPTAPTQVNYNSPGFNTSAIDKAAQAVLQQNPNFNADAITQRFKDNIKANIDTLASIGMSEQEIQRRIAPEIKKFADQVKDYINTAQYQKPADQQNVTGRSIQSVYGMGSQPQVWDPFKQSTQSASQPQQTATTPSVNNLNQQFNNPNAQSTARYLPNQEDKKGPTVMPFTATK